VGSLEPAVGEARAQDRHARQGPCGRGSVTGEHGATTEWDEEAADAALDRLARVRGARQINSSRTGRTALADRQRAALGSPTLPADAETSAVLLGTLGQALRGLAAMRAKEGEALLVDFVGRRNCTGRSR
jgi:uncharacterized protein YicC (UPF0701 family)